MSLPPDADEPGVSAEAASQEIRNKLRWRINTCTHPSRLINHIALADQRCAESTQALAHLIGRSPKVLTQIRAELRKAFDIDPDSLLFTESELPGVPQKTDTLTDRAMLSLVRPSVVINLNSFTVLSVKGDPGRRLPYTPLDVLQRVIAMKLWDRLARVTSRYWATLAEGSWLTRREHCLALHAQLFADRAFIARQLDELSRDGMVMVQAIIDAPTAEARQRAGGDWASVQVGQLMWPGTPSVAIPGALHIYREGNPSGVPHVIFLPGLVRNFHEYPTFTAVQCGLLELGNARFHNLWQCLPLARRNVLCQPADLSTQASFLPGQAVTGDALTQATEALLDGQWSNELACAAVVNQAHVFSVQRPRPEPLNAVLFLRHVEGARQQLIGDARLADLRDQLLKWDQQRRSAEIVFASMAPGLALRTAEDLVMRYEKGLVALLTPGDPSAQTPAYQELLSLVSQLEVHAQALKTVMKNALQRSLDLDFWAERPGGPGTPRRVTLFMGAQTEALRCEVQLQHRLKLLSTAHRDLMIEVIEQPLAARRAGSETRVLSIAVGSEPDAFYPLHGVWVVTTAAAVRVPTRQRPVVLYAFGLQGGVLAFSGLNALTGSLKASLSSRDDCALWGYVESDKRRDLQAHAARATLGVRYVEIQGKPALVAVKKLLGANYRIHHCPEDIVRIFSEVTDAALSRTLLLAQLQDCLSIPVNRALSQAQANIGLLRKVASEAKKMPVWLARATRAQRKNFRRSQRLYLSGAFAFASRLGQQLPDLGTFTRRALVARLIKDGMTEPLDLNQPLIEMPDDVQGSFCGWASTCTVGDRNIVLTPTAARTTFSLQQLALHNLDPQAPWTKLRFNRARYLQPAWKERLNADYLISMVSSLDIGGQYDALINRLFYPPAGSRDAPSEGRIPELLNRALKAGFKHHLLLAIQRGMTIKAQSVFRTAMAARTPPDLLKNQHQLQLHVVHLVGHTMQHDRYIAGIVVVQDKRSGLCVMYWPEAPQALVLTEYSSLQQALDELNRVGASADNAKALARQIAPGWAFEAFNHDPLKGEESAPSFPLELLLPGLFMFRGLWIGAEFIRSFSVKHLEATPLLGELEKVLSEQITCHPQQWLATVATSHSNASALLYRASVLDLQRRTQEASRSGKELEKYRLRRLGEQSDARMRRLVAAVSQFFFPPLAQLIDAYELLLVARDYHRTGDARLAVDVGFMSAFLAVDLLLNFLPGPVKTGGVAARAARPALRSSLGRLHRLRMTARGGLTHFAASAVKQLKALERFKTKGGPEGSVALNGPSEQGIYVKNGERFIADDTHIYPIYLRKNEEFFRMKNTQAQGQNELIVYMMEAEWTLRADAPQPVAGTSSQMLNPFPAPVSAPADWWPPIVRTSTENRILQSFSNALHWLDWRMSIQINAQLSSPAPGIFQVPVDARGFSYNALRIAPVYTTLADPTSGFYRLLPQGNQAPLNRIVFITKNEQLVSLARVDIERWTSTDILEQPLAVSRTPSNGWQLHTPLFEKPLTDYVAEAFPAMTSKSREFTVARMIELAGPSRPATATHMLNIRATLDDWLPPAPAKPGQTDDILRMLRPTERGKTTTFISYHGAAPGFTRVDFLPPFLLDRSLQRAGKQLAAQRDIAQRQAVKRVLEDQGFIVREFKVTRGGRVTHEAIATHASSPNRLYYVYCHWLEMGYVTFGARLTDNWFMARSMRYMNRDMSAQVHLALREQRLVRIWAGIHWPVRGHVSATVYFIKLTP